VLQAEAQLVLQPATWTLLKSSRTKSQHTTNREQKERCGNSTTQLQAPDDGYINV